MIKAFQDVDNRCENKVETVDFYCEKNLVKYQNRYFQGIQV
jgi:hypothetical protein